MPRTVQLRRAAAGAADTTWCESRDGVAERLPRSVVLVSLTQEKQSPNLEPVEQDSIQEPSVFDQHCRETRGRYAAVLRPELSSGASFRPPSASFLPLAFRSEERRVGKE